MFEFSSQANLIIQGCIAAIIIGVFYSLWSTRLYGGIIGQAIRLFGLGMLFVTISVIERVLVNFNIVSATVNLGVLQDIASLIGLIFLGLGFSKLGQAAKS